MNNVFKGLGTALVTPFDQIGESIDFQSLERLLNQQIEHGVDFIVVMGTTGESPTISWSEKIELLNFVIDKCYGKIKIVFGLGGNNTEEIAEKITEIPSQVDGLLSVSPYYNKPSQKGIVRHYQHIASKTKLPIILYNVPPRTGSNIMPETVLELAQVENIVAIKEASGNVDQIMEVIRIVPSGFDVLSGDDALTLPLIASGAVGLISVISNAYPKKMRELISYSLANNFTQARSIHLEMLPVIRQLFEQGSPSGVKTLLKSKGDIAYDSVRMPLAQVSDDFQGILQNTARDLAAKGWT